MAKWQFEKTDTFGGEANYSWVERTVVEVPDGIGDGLLRMMAKQWAGYAGRRCDIENAGDQQVIRPRGLCQVLFVSFVDSLPDDFDARAKRMGYANVLSALTALERKEKQQEAMQGLVRWVEHCGLEKNPALAGIDMKPLEVARKALQS